MSYLGKRTKLNNKKCNYCGKINGTGNKYCSSGCKKASSKEMSIQKINNANYGKAICPVCSTEFNKKNTHHKYCTIECQKKVYNFDLMNLEENYDISFDKPNRWIKLRFEIFKRDNFTCQYCGRNVKEDKVKLHCDHINPKNLGGNDTFENLITSCEECNLGKSDVLLSNRLYEKKEKK